MTGKATKLFVHQFGALGQLPMNSIEYKLKTHFVHLLGNMAGRSGNKTAHSEENKSGFIIVENVSCTVPHSIFGLRQGIRTPRN